MTPQELGFTREGNQWVRWEQAEWGMYPARYTDEEMQRQFGAEVQAKQAAQQYHMERNPDPYAQYRGALAGLPTYQRAASNNEGYDGYYSEDGRRLAGFNDTWGGTGTTYYDVNDLNRVLPGWQTLNVVVPAEQTEYSTTNTGTERMFGTYLPRPSSDGIIAGLNFGDIAQMAGLVGGAYGLGSMIGGAGAAGTASASAGASAPAAAAPASASTGLGFGGGAPGFGLTGPGTIADIAAGAYSGAAPLANAGLNLGGIAEMANLAAGLPAAGAASTGLPWLDFMTANPGQVVNLANSAAAIAPQTTLLGGLVTPPTPTGDWWDKTKETAKTLAPYAPLIGGALGAAAGALGGGSKPAGSITIEEDIPDWLKAYMKPTLDKYSTEIQNYQTDPYGIMPAAQREFLNTVSGMYLDPSTNKYLPEYFRLGAERVKGNLAPSFGHMQAFGSHSGYNEALSRGLSDLAVGLYGGAYEKERNRQSQLTAAAPNFLSSSSQSAFAPYTDYINTISGLGKKKEQPYFNNQFSNILGGALAGYGLRNLYK